MTRDKYVYQQTSDHTSEGTFATIVGGSQDHYAVHVRAKLIRFLGQGSINFHEVHDEEEHESVRNTTSRGLFGSKTKTVHASSSAAHSKRGVLESENPIGAVSRSSDVTACNTTFNTPKTILKALKGRVRILLGTEYSSSSRSERSSNLLWQRMSQRIEEHKTYIPCLFTGSLEIHSSETVVESVRGQTLDWINRIDQHGGPIVYSMLEELHRVESHSVQGPSAAFSMVIALAATIASQGAGAGLVGATGVVSTAMANATFAALCSQAAVALVTHQGNLGRAAESLANDAMLKALVTSMATAGLSETGLGRAGAGFAVDVATGKKIDEAALNAARVAVATTLQATAARYIGSGGFNPIARAAMHGVSGAAAGAVLSRDAESGAISGAISAIAATTVAHFIKEDPNVIGERAVAKARADGSSLDKLSLEPYVQAELKGMIDISKLSAAVATLFAGYDVTIGIDVATTAVINNCAQALTKEVFKAIGGLVATTMAGGFLAKKQTEDALHHKMDTIPEDAEWIDEGLATEEGKPAVHATPAEDHKPMDQGFSAAPEDFRGWLEGFSDYDGPDTSVLEKEESSLYRGGAYGDLERIAEFDRHHMPADSISSVARNAGPSIHMERGDHRQTASYGSSLAARSYREKTQTLIDKGDMRGAMAEEVLDVRKVGGSKYNSAILEMLEYAKKSGIVPLKK